MYAKKVSNDSSAAGGPFHRNGDWLSPKEHKFENPMPYIPRPAQGLPQRSVSSDSNNSDAKMVCDPLPSVDDLLEEWPRRMSCMSASSSINSVSFPEDMSEPLHVSFSQRSKLHIFPSDARYLKHASYKHSDRKQFTKEALLEALRIKKLIADAPGSSADSIRFLFEANIIAQEEVLGIEHLILDNSAARIMKERRAHAESLLLEQSRQRKSFGEGKFDEYSGKLAECATARSLKSSKRARIRAALAA